VGSVHNYMKRTCQDDISPIDLDLVAKCLCELKCGKAAGPNGIEPEYLLCTPNCYVLAYFTV